MQGQVVSLRGNPALFPHVDGPAQPTQALAYTFQGLETPGTHHLVAALVPPGAFEDGIIHGDDLVAFASEAIQVQTTSPLYSKMQAIRQRHASQ